MQEFSSISVSTYSPDDLTSQLNTQAKEGWRVVAIVPTGSSVTAYLSRDASADATAADATPEVVSDVPTSDTPEAAVAAVADEQPGAEVAAAATTDHFEVAAATTPEPAAEPAVEPTLPTSEPAAEPAAEAAVAAAPAGWYADPSSRFELRYWDGSTWTEHVSRGGQQFTDPPVA